LRVGESYKIGYKTRESVKIGDRGHRVIKMDASLYKIGTSVIKIDTTYKFVIK
jgi:hypothetical protein